MRPDSGLALAIFSVSAGTAGIWFAALTVLASLLSGQTAPTRRMLGIARVAAVSFYLALAVSAATGALALGAYWRPGLLQSALVLMGVLLALIPTAGLIMLYWLLGR